MKTSLVKKNLFVLRELVVDLAQPCLKQLVLGVSDPIKQVVVLCRSKSFEFR